MENAEKQRWAKRLRALAERAGVHGDPDRSASSDGILSAEEKARLQLLVFTSGAPSTMANHIRRFEKFERWAHRSGIDFYPITDDKVLKYAMDLDARDCGPTVLPSLRTAIRWVAFRVNFKIPSIDTAAMKALEKDVFTKRGKTSQGGNPVRHRAGQSWSASWSRRLTRPRLAFSCGGFSARSSLLSGSTTRST